jgi:hypothetical protein
LLMPMLGNSKAMIFGAMGLVLLGAVSLLCVRSNPVFSAVAWHLNGVVYDNASNRLSAVKIVVDGTGTARNGIFGSTVTPVHYEWTNDQTGKFSLDFRAAAFKLVFSKDNYAPEEYTLEHIGLACDNTDQVLEVKLDPISSGVRRR